MSAGLYPAINDNEFSLLKKILENTGTIVDSGGGGSLPSQTGNAGKFLTTDGTSASWVVVAGTGTVTSVSVTTANGVSGSVATATTTPAITLTLGDITPTSVVTSAAITAGTTFTDQSGLIGSRTAALITQTTHGFVAGDVVYSANGTWTKAKADAVGTTYALGVVESAPTANTFVVVYSGRITLSGLTASSLYYLSDATAGATTATAPTTVTSFVVPILRTGTSTVAYVMIGAPCSLAKISLTTDVSGILPTANGGTGIAYFTAAGPTVARVYTFPDAAATIARTDAAQTFSGVQTFGVTTVFGDAASAILVVIAGGAAQNRVIDFRTGANSRWKILANNAAEAGSNAGSDWLLNAYDDAGTIIDTPFTITRAAGGQIATPRIFHTTNTTASSSTITGSGIFGGGLGVAGAAYIGGILNVAGHVTLEGVTSTGATGTGKLVFDTSATLVTPILGTPTSGTLTNCTADGTNLLGYRGVPQNSQSAAYTTVLADAGKEVYHPVGDANARTFTIDSNANVAYPIGTVIIFTNMSANAVTIAITSDTLYWFGTGGTGSRTLAQYGTCAARKLTSTTWGISGINLT